MLRQLTVEYRTTESLVPYAGNARTHSAAQVVEIARSINEFGFTNPILIDDTGLIVAGHGRLQAAQKLKLAEVPTITLHGLSNKQKRALVLADNRIQLNAGWDFDLLTHELDALRDDGFDVSLLGFSAEELNDMIGTPNVAPADTPESASAMCKCPSCGYEWQS
ncbi:MAG: ParB N-terminal domain-containing protein [Alphaproteobacteria bacterium]|nr:ParB N-terminal domain-containing protein [Alphaproteobacteria bacterium]